MKSKVKLRPVGELLETVSRPQTVTPDAEYRLLGVRLDGAGPFHRETKFGRDSSARTLYHVESGDFIYSRLFAWRGAFGIVGDGLSGAFVSNEFPLFRTKPGEADPHFLNYVFQLPTTLHQVETLCIGSTPVTRNRFHERFFLKMRIPVPSLPEQQRIVAWLNGLASRVTTAQALGNGLKADAAAFVASLHLQLAGQRRVKLSEVFDLDEVEEPVVSTGSYPQVGIRGFGGGLFQKSAVAGTGTTYRSFHRLYPDAIVLSQVKGWEGAIAVAGPELNGWFASPEYRTFRCKPETAHPDYMRALLPTPWFIERLQGLSRGQGARRQRTRPEQFLALELPMPTRAQQETALRAFSKMHRALESLPGEADLAALLPSALAQVFGGNTKMMGPAYTA